MNLYYCMVFEFNIQHPTLLLDTRMHAITQYRYIQIARLDLTLYKITRGFLAYLVGPGVPSLHPCHGLKLTTC